MNTSQVKDFHFPGLPSLTGVPQDYTFRTTLLSKGNLAPAGKVWLELRITITGFKGSRKVYKYHEAIPKELSEDQRAYFAASMRSIIQKFKPDGKAENSE